MVVIGHLAEAHRTHRKEPIQLVAYQAEEADTLGQEGGKIDKGSEGKNSNGCGERSEGRVFEAGSRGIIINL